jgi:hypothetical protein
LRGKESLLTMEVSRGLHQGEGIPGPPVAIRITPSRERPVVVRRVIGDDQ